MFSPNKKLHTSSLITQHEYKRILKQFCGKISVQTVNIQHHSNRNGILSCRLHLTD